MIFGFEQRVWSAMQTLEDQVWAGKRIVVQLRAIWTVLWGGPVRLRQAQPESQNCVGEDEVAIDVGTLHPEEGSGPENCPENFFANLIGHSGSETVWVHRDSS